MTNEKLMQRINNKPTTKHSCYINAYFTLQQMSHTINLSKYQSQQTGEQITVQKQEMEK